MPESDHALPTIGIVSPSYNQGAFIGAMLNSIERQTLAPAEHIILDGGSKDDSREQIAAYAQRHGYAKAVLEPDDGQVDAINKGLESAQSEVLTWLNTDDFYSDAGALRAVAQVFADEPDTDVVYARGEFIDAQGKVLREAYVNRKPETFPETIKHSIGILQPALFFRRSAIEKAGLLDGRWNLSLDYELWIRFISAGLKMKFVDRSIVRAVLHDESKTGGSRGKQYHEIEALTAEHFGFVPLRWLERHAEFLVGGKDGILRSGGSETDRDKIDAEIGRLQQQWNASPEAIAAIEACKNEPEAMRTLADLCRRGMLDVQRVAVTSFTSAYFRQGLNVLASLGRHAKGRFDRVLVYSIDLTDEQKQRLAAFDGVVVLDYPGECGSFFEGYFEPKNYSYKCAAIWDAQHAVGDGGTVLWIDAGVALVRPIDEVLAIIDRDGVFFVDHDDKPGWPFLNATFTHPVAARAMDAAADELLAPHLCSCFLGYRTGTVGNELIDEAYRFSQSADVVAHSKHPPAGEKREFAALTPEDREWLEAATASPDRATREQVLERTAYLGHRQDQTIYSILCARHQCKQHSAKRFCWSDDASSKASLANWKSGGEGDLQRTRKLPASMPATALTFHHRGLLDQLEGLPWLRQSETVFVLGNGPSLKGFDFASLDAFDTIGMNAAYRHWDRTGWYPSIYACMDTVVIKSHATEIERLVRERRANGIRLFFLRRDIVELCPSLATDPSVVFFEDLQASSDLLDTGMITTGSLSALFGGFLGYKRVAVLGVDCDYVEQLPEAKGGQGHQLVINETPATNPNYFFDDYQQKGDAYNIPNVHPGFHARSWKAALGLLEAHGTEIVNCNAQSKLKALPMAELEAVLSDSLAMHERSSIVGGAYGRDAKARIEEIDFIAEAIGQSHVDDLMVDVGTHHGGSLKPFLESGWRVLGFEPDPENRKAVTGRFGAHPRLTIDQRAVSDKPAEGVNFFSTDESSGASSLSAFTVGHEASATVDVTTLDVALAEHHVDAVRLLKVDAEGYDLMVLKGLPWERLRPDAIMVEFEDRKTKPIGYTTGDMAEALVERGYTVFCSEWHPIVRYGIRHDWRRMFRWGTEQPDGQSWGNLVAFRYEADADAFEQQVLAAIRRGELTGAPKAAPAPATRASASAPPKKPAAAPTGAYEQRIERLAQLASHAASTQPAPLPPQPMVVGAMPWAPKALGEMSPAKHVALSVGKIGRVYAGRAGVLAFATLACWAAGVATLANGQPYWVGLALAGAAFIPLFVLIGFIAVTARRQSFENCETLRYAAERGIRWAAEHQRGQQRAAGGYTNTLVAESAHLLAAQERRRLATRLDLGRKLDACAPKHAIAEVRKQIAGAIAAADSARASAKALDAELAQARRDTDTSLASIGTELRTEIASAREASRQQLTQAATLAELSRSLAEQALDTAKTARTEQQQTAQSHAEGIKKALKTAQAAGELASDAGHDADESLTKHAARTDARLDEGDHQLSRLRGDAYTQFLRVITPALEEGVAKLGVPLQRGELKYMERKLQVIEGQCEGRLAGSIDDAIARSLSARTWKGEELRILEIGVLFGIGAIYMHRVLRPFFDSVHLTLLDPFDGYYGPDHLDPLTGQPVTRAMLERNLSRGGVPMDDVTIIDRFSTDGAAVKLAAESGPYAVVIIDGDHSYDGVKADYELYADMVAPGGVLIVDDFGSKDWPEVTAYTNEVIERDKRFARVAVLGKTAIYRRTAVRAGSTAETKPAAKPAVKEPAKPGGKAASKPKPTPKPAAKSKAKPEAKPSGTTNKPATKTDPARQPADGSLPFAD